MIDRAEAGRRFWCENNMDRFDRILVLPDDNIRLHDAILLIYEEKLKKQKAAGVDTDVAVLAFVPVHASTMYEIIKVTRDEVNNIISLYSMYEFTGKLIIGSFCCPKGRKLENLLNNKIASEYVLIHDVILGGINGADVSC